MHRTLRPFRAASLLCAAALLVLSAAAASAQGFYLKEITRDGRIYVFNIAENAARFEKTGEMGIGITKPGVGPNGETVVGDNERALQLYFFRHNIDEVIPDPVVPIQTIVWRDSKTRITTDLAYLEISNRIQARFTEESPDDATQLPGTEAAGDSKPSFRIRRAKFKLEGWMISPWLTYEMQVNYPALNGANLGALLEDAVFDIDFSKGLGKFRVRMGQFKPPFGVQEMISSGNQMFVDRSLASNTFFRGRETGVALWGATPNNKFEWRVGAFNGNSMTRTGNDNAKLQYNARLMWQPNGSQILNQRAWVTGALYSESDFESTTAPIYALAINYESQNNFFSTTGNDQKWNAVGVDGIYKYNGFSVNGMYSMAMRTPETGAEFDSWGGYLQAGKLFSRRRYEVGIRYATEDPNDTVNDNNRDEIRGVFSYYHARHGLKLQTDFGQVKTRPGGGAREIKLFEVRSQLQFVF